ncbi:MerR family transcriptional regulator [Christensenella intestinihominis]|uniref:MerR family transcriptional regulator n=1 Tax=Christensenella intestinihominis TaxID=1851429 RepID=UPI00082B870B|nr:MerR family transcriptional regulator [Christensenella intestinihominis]
MTVKEMSRIAGVSVRTLHYYDEIGLLRPGTVTEAGYRIYGEKELVRLQQILFFRELGFPLKEIRSIMENPSFDEKEALLKQRKLLELKQERLSGLMRLIDKTLKGDKHMSFEEFDESRLEEMRREYAREARERWGETEAYRQSEERTAGYGKGDWARLDAEMEGLFRRFAEAMEFPPEDGAVQALVREWQQHITRNYYECTDEILAGLGKMYIADRRFAKNIDRYGKGLAEFMSKAIAHYCK